MIAKVQRGSDTAGLLRYLLGPGRANEHTDPHVVACSSPEWARGGELAGRVHARGGAARLARDLDAAMLDHEVRPAGGHVYHVVLALHPDDPAPGTAGWCDLVTDAVGELGVGTDRADGRGGCRWAAVHHGRSVAGADHVHLVVNLVRGDGRTADVRGDFGRWRAWCRRVERERGFAVTGPPGSGQRRRPRREVADARGSGRAVTRRGASTHQLRHLLVQWVHAAAMAAPDEATFLHRLRRFGIAYRPRVVEGRVVGYAVRGSGGIGRTGWVAGGTLRRDLSLPRLRQRWHGAALAPHEWRADPPPNSPVEPVRGDSGQNLVHRRLVLVDRVVRDLLRRPDPDPALWHAVARQVADLALVAPQSLPRDAPDAAARELCRGGVELAVAEPDHQAAADLRDRGVALPILGAATRAVIATGSLTPILAAALVLAVYGLVRLLADRAEHHQVHSAAGDRAVRAERHVHTAVTATAEHARQYRTAPAPTVTSWRGQTPLKRPAAPSPPRPQPRRR